MTQVSDREVLQELAARPIGSPELQREAESNMAAYQRGALKPSSDLKEAAQRANKKWLPAGKKPTRGPEVTQAEAAFYERQIDLEDAVEAAGGKRGAHSGRAA